VDGGGLKKTHLPLRCKRLSQLHTTDIRRTYLPRKQTNFTKPPPLLFFFCHQRCGIGRNRKRSEIRRIEKEVEEEEGKGATCKSALSPTRTKREKRTPSLLR